MHVGGGVKGVCVLRVWRLALRAVSGTPCECSSRCRDLGHVKEYSQGDTQPGA